MAKIKYENFNEQMNDLYVAFREACGEAKVEDYNAEWKKMLNVFADEFWMALTDYRYNLDRVKELLEFFEELAQGNEPTTNN